MVFSFFLGLVLVFEVVSFCFGIFWGVDISFFREVLCLNFVFFVGFLSISRV